MKNNWTGQCSDSFPVSACLKSSQFKYHSVRINSRTFFLLVFLIYLFFGGKLLLFLVSIVPLKVPGAQSPLPLVLWDPRLSLDGGQKWLIESCCQTSQIRLVETERVLEDLEIDIQINVTWPFTKLCKTFWMTHIRPNSHTLHVSRSQKQQYVMKFRPRPLVRVPNTDTSIGTDTEVEYSVYTRTPIPVDMHVNYVKFVLQWNL